jgi:hypothetical protein
MHTRITTMQNSPFNVAFCTQLRPYDLNNLNPHTASPNEQYHDDRLYKEREGIGGRRVPRLALYALRIGVTGGGTLC